MSWLLTLQYSYSLLYFGAEKKIHNSLWHHTGNIIWSWLSFLQGTILRKHKEISWAAKIIRCINTVARGVLGQILSSTLAWKLPWTEPGGLQSMGSLEWDTTERLHFHFSLSCIGEGNGNPLQCSCLENPRDGKPGGLPSMGSHRVGHDWSDLTAARDKSDFMLSGFSG